MTHLVTLCCLCEKVRDDREPEPGLGMWQQFSVYMAKYGLRPAGIRLVHTYCPGCLAYYQAFLSSSQEARQRSEKEGKS